MSGTARAREEPVQRGRDGSDRARRVARAVGRVAERDGPRVHEHKLRVGRIRGRRAERRAQLRGERGVERVELGTCDNVHYRRAAAVSVVRAG